MNYFRFEIPKGLHYSPGWFGTMPKCPRDVEALLYNDRDGYGIARTPDKLPKEVQKMKELDALILVDDIEEGEGVYKGENVLIRKEWLPKAIPETFTIIPPEGEPLKTEVKNAYFCPICHKFIMFLSSKLQAGNIIVTCPDGHRVVLNG